LLRKHQERQVEKDDAGLNVGEVDAVSVLTAGAFVEVVEKVSSGMLEDQRAGFGFVLVPRFAS